MKIEFKKLTLHNFLSFGHTTLDINDDGFIKVSGINQQPEDMAISNGSGKSSLWEAIVWSLTGETIRGTKQVSNIYEDDGTYVEVEFNIDNKNYCITRSKDHKVFKTNLKIVIDGKDCSGKGIRDSEKLLAEYLPDITASLLGSVIILGQGLPQKFSNNTPSGRKEVLEKLSKSDFMIEDLKRRVTSRKLELNEILRRHQDEAMSLSGKKSALENLVKQSQELLSTLNKDDIELKIHSLQEQEATLQFEIDKINSTIFTCNSEVEKLNEELRLILSDFIEHKKLIEEKYSEKISLFTSQSSTFTAELSILRKELSKLDSITDICPTCGQKLPDIIKPDTRSIKHEIETKLVELNSVNAQLQELKDSQKSELLLIETKKQEKEMLIKQQLSVHTKSVVDLNNSLSNYSNQLSNVTSELDKDRLILAELEANINYHSDLIKNSMEQINDINESLLYNNTQADITKSRLDIQTKFDTALKRDFRGHLLSSVIEYISNRAKIYSQIIFETDKIGFELDGNNIEISYQSKSYENLSGGEKQKVDIIVQFSIRDMLCSYLGFSSNIIVLDEVFDALDMIGCQRVLDVISSISDIKNIFIVTHRKDLSIPCDKELIVVKSSNGISELQ